MDATSPLRTRWIPITAALIVIVDQAVKALVIAQVPLHARIAVVDGFLAITHVHNRGMAFGIFNTVDTPWLRWALVAVAILAVAIVWAYARHETDRTAVLLAFGAVLGGAVGNLIDRLRLGYVVDFVLAHWGRYEWPAFNVADAAITMGGIVLFVALAREQPAPESSELAEPTGAPGVEAGEVRRDQV